jgi:hypothetical protein
MLTATSASQIAAWIAGAHVSEDEEVSATEQAAGVAADIQAYNCGVLSDAMLLKSLIARAGRDRVIEQFDFAALQVSS